MMRLVRRPLPRAVRRTLWMLVGFVMIIATGNLGIAAAYGLVQLKAAEDGLDIPGVGHERVVDERLWRGDGPERRGYRELAARGVRTVVDLRAERHLDVPEELLDELDIERVHIPIRDGQTPTRAQVERFLEVMRTTDHIVYLHCGAGVGRTGVMAAAYLAATGQAGRWEALRRNLAIGPPSLEQIVYAASLEPGSDIARQPPRAVEIVSRLFDGPRRIWHVINAR